MNANIKKPRKVSQSMVFYARLNGKVTSLERKKKGEGGGGGGGGEKKGNKVVKKKREMGRKYERVGEEESR